MGRLVAIAACLMMATPSLAAECLQGNAIYGDDDNAYRIVFEKLEDGGPITTSNRFTFTTAEGRKLMDGYVIWNQGFSLPNGTMTYNCPPGDKTGEEMTACTIWEGIVYSIAPDGDVDLIPPEEDPAAHALLFPGLGRAIHYSAMNAAENLPLTPWDKFSYAGCSDSP